MMSSESVQGKISRKRKKMGQGTCRPTSGIGYCRRTFGCEGIDLVFVYNAQIKYLFLNSCFYMKPDFGKCALLSAPTSPMLSEF